jgi:hypothetical protein
MLPPSKNNAALAILGDHIFHFSLRASFSFAASSFFQSSYLAHALKCQFVTAVSPLALRTKMGRNRESSRDWWALGKNRRRKDLRRRISGCGARRVPWPHFRRGCARARLARDGARCPHTPTESERIFRASRFFRAARRATWRRAAPIPQACGSHRRGRSVPRVLVKFERSQWRNFSRGNAVRLHSQWPQEPFRSEDSPGISRRHRCGGRAGTASCGEYVNAAVLGQLRRASGSHSTIKISSLSADASASILGRTDRDEGMAPEFEAAFRPGALEADAIHGRDEHAVGDGVGALNRAPGVELRRAEFLLSPTGCQPIAVG